MERLNIQEEKHMPAKATKKSTAAISGNGTKISVGNPADREKFVVEMLPYVKYLAHRIATGLPPSVDLNDLVNYGIIGLLDACRKYDESKGVKFKTYAETRIRGAILDGMRAADWVPRSVRRKRRDLENAYRLAEQDLGRPATDTEVAARMQVSVTEFRSIVNDVQGVSLGSLEELSSGADDGIERIAVGFTRDPEAHDPQVLVEREEMRGIVAKAVAELPEKERFICSLYYYDELTMKEIGMTLGISESRVSQLHTKAMSRVRTRLEEMVGPELVVV